MIFGPFTVTGPLSIKLIKYHIQFLKRFGSVSNTITLTLKGKVERYSSLKSKGYDAI